MKPKPQQVEVHLGEKDWIGRREPVKVEARVTIVHEGLYGPLLMLGWLIALGLMWISRGG